MRHIFCAVLVLIALPLAATTVANNDSCDIGTYPAATLLLPYFEVSLGPVGSGNTTIFSVTNVTATPQIARVTLWTDWGFPLISFDLFLTGYDVQPVNLYDILARGIIASTQGTSTAAPNARDSSGKSTNPNAGTTPMTNLANPNFQTSVATTCGPGHLPGQLPSPLINDIRLALSTGSPTGVSISCRNIGSNHGASVAAGYMTIDVVSTCSPAMPNDANYWSELLYDNALTGDYAVIANDPTKGNYAAGNPMVHIRAIPSGLPSTFYSRFTANDRRQPLPSTFAARWIAGSNAAFETSYTIWRDGNTAGGAPCDDYSVKNSAIPFGEIVRFDERENAGVSGTCMVCNPPFPLGTPVSSHQPTTNVIFPVIYGSTDNGGWTYFNLSNPAISAHAGQAWVTVSMFAEGRFGVEYDATALGNGCSPAAGPSDTTQIGPRP